MIRLPTKWIPCGSTGAEVLSTSEEGSPKKLIQVPYFIYGYWLAIAKIVKINKRIKDDQFQHPILSKSVY